MIKKIAYIGVITLLITSIISCEKDFTDIGTNIVGNTKFDINSEVFDIALEPTEIEKIRTDNNSLGSLPSISYLLGVYKNNDYKKLEASFVSQVGYKTFETLTSGDTRVIDAAFITLPFPATKSTKKEEDGKPIFTIDSVMRGTIPNNVTIQVYRNGTFLNNLNPLNPTKKNKYFSNIVYNGYTKLDNLTKELTFKLSANPKDTIYVFDRFKTNTTIEKDTIKLGKVSPFLTIPLDTQKIKTILLNQSNSADFASAKAFGEYFRGLIIEATGDNGVIIPFNLSSITPNLSVYYSDVRYSGTTIDTIIRHTTSFPITGIKTAYYKTVPATNVTPTNSVTLQGAVGDAGKITLLTPQQIINLKAKNWLINDATLTFYIDASRDTTQVPKRIFLYKENINNGVTTSSQIKDAYTEASFFGGNLELADGKPEKYTFKITDYISDILNATSTETLSPLVVKVYNNYTDNAVKNNNLLDTIVKSYSWNPKMVTLLNGNKTINGDKRAQLKISYSIKK